MSEDKAGARLAEAEARSGRAAGDADAAVRIGAAHNSATADVPRLIAAVRAGLALADDWDQHACGCGGSICTPMDATALDCARKLRAAITRELLKEG